MMDISCVQAFNTIADIDCMVGIAKKYKLICAFALPAFTPYLIDALKDEPDILVGGVVGFPSGQDSTAMKAITASELLEMGCDEIDMVINVGALKSGMDDFVFEDICAVKQAIGKTTLKTILEVQYLTDDEIRRGCRLGVKAGASFIKTSTGWTGRPTTMDHIRLMKETIGNSAGIKAAGGVRDLKTLLAMREAGCTRFGVSVNTAVGILEELDANEAGG
jgi:deoxyribose-phosphate aldolase